jgi:hypothetical protein
MLYKKGLRSISKDKSLNKLLLLLFLFSLTAQADFKVKNDEMHKKGLIIIEQAGIPLGPAYKEINRHRGGNKLRMDPTGKFISLKFAKARWKVYVPPTYNSTASTGLVILLDTYKDPGRENEDVMAKYKYAAGKFNVILILIDCKAPPIDLKMDPTVASFAEECQLLLRRSVDLANERYKINPDRVFLYSGIVDTIAAFGAAIYCPDVFRNFISEGAPDPWWEMEVDGVGKKAPSFGSQAAAITTLKKASKNRFVFTSTKTIEGLRFRNTEALDKMLKKYKFSKYSFETIDSSKGQKALDVGIAKIDPDPFDSSVYMKNAMAFEKRQDFSKAFENYKLATAYGVAGAKEKFEPMEKELNRKTAEMTKGHKAKDYALANNTAKQIINKFGQQNSPIAVKFYKAYLSDKKVVLEIKAAAYLSKAAEAFKKANPAKDKVKAACEKVIKLCPGTVTAQKAKDLLTKVQ